MNTIRTALVVVGLLVGANADAYVRCETTAGDFTLQVVKSWAPNGYLRFMELIDDDFFQNQIIFRAMEGFVYQFGIHGDPDVQKKWQTNYIPDDPAKLKFEVGHVSFAGFGENSRSSHIFIASGKRATNLGRSAHERPFAKFHNEQELEHFLTSVNTKHGDIQIQPQLVEKGNIAAAEYPDLTVIKFCRRITSKEAKRFKNEIEKKLKIEKKKIEAEKKTELEKQNKIKGRKQYVLKRIESILGTKAPKVLKKLPKMLKHWEGKEEGLLESLEKKYGVSENDEL